MGRISYGWSRPRSGPSWSVAGMLCALSLLATSCAKPSVGAHAPPTDLPDPPWGYWEAVQRAEDLACCWPMIEFEASCMTTDKKNDAAAGRDTPIIKP